MNPTSARAKIKIFLIVWNHDILLSPLVMTKYSIITGKTSASEFEQIAPIKLINNPTFGTRIATVNVTNTINILNVNSLIIGLFEAQLIDRLTSGNKICIGI